MRVGTICYATDQGLGVLAKSFYDNGVVTDALVLHHHSRPTHLEWYPDSSVITHKDLNVVGFSPKIIDFVKNVDVMLFFETPFDWNVIPYCQKRGVKTVLMPMYECMPRQLPFEPDYFVCPSLLDLDCFPNRSEFIPVPVSEPWNLRMKADTFVHNAGHLGLNGRNGTAELLLAIPMVKSRDVKFIIRSQDPISWTVRDPRVEIQLGTVKREQLYKRGDVFVFPEKFNGLSLPLQEAAASGMAVMCMDRYPVNTWLHRDILVPVKEYRRSCVSPRCLEFDEVVVDPAELAKSIDRWHDREITHLSIHGREWAEKNSWKVLKPSYMKALS